MCEIHLRSNSVNVRVPEDWSAQHGDDAALVTGVRQQLGLASDVSLVMVRLYGCLKI